MNPTVSVVIPHFAASGTIVRAVSSALEQTLPPHEVIVVDDASPDREYERTVEALSNFPDRVRLMRLPVNGGPAAARNAGWEAATGDYIAFLDADDSWLPAKLAIQMQFVEHLKLDLIGGRNVPLGTENGSNRSATAGSCSTVSPSHILLGNPFSTSSVVLRRNLTVRFNHRRRYAEDFELWLRLILSGARGGRHSAPLSVAYKSPFGDTGLSANLGKMTLSAVDVYYRAWARKELSSPKLFVSVSWCLVRGIRRYGLVAMRRLKRAAAPSSSA